MAHLVHIALRVLAGVTGALSLYAALFLYEDEQGKVQNKLEEWWVRVRDTQTVALSRQASFMREVARMATVGFDRLFGERLFSLRSFTVSLCCSGASIWLGVAVFADFGANAWLARLVCIWLALLSTSVGVVLTPTPGARRSRIRYGVALLVGASPFVVIFAAIADFHRLHTATLLKLVEDSVLIWLPILSFCCDIGFIALTRRLLRWVSAVNEFPKALAIVVFNLALASPLLLIGAGVKHPSPVRGMITVLLMSNMIDGIVASVFVVLTAVMLTHRLLWPLIDRLLYALQGIGIARRRWLFGAIGVTLLGWGGWRLPEALKEIVKTVAG
jgi:hypothetical protein